MLEINPWGFSLGSRPDERDRVPGEDYASVMKKSKNFKKISPKKITKISKRNQEEIQTKTDERDQVPGKDYATPMI